ncbi:MAG: SlyX family protein [Spirochaetales bacterium]|nr:SlyX family protein [Spirochaetales bacterium]
MDNNIEKVEIKISYLENQVKDLNEVVVNQMKDIDALSIQLLKLEQKVLDLIEEAGDGDRPSRKPPHY